MWPSDFDSAHCGYFDGKIWIMRLFVSSISSFIELEFRDQAKGLWACKNAVLGVGVIKIFRNYSARKIASGGKVYHLESRLRMRFAPHSSGQITSALKRSSTKTVLYEPFAEFYK